jgi:hypothetical protein
MANDDARGMGMDGRRISPNEEDYVQEGDSSEGFGEHYRGSATIPASEPSSEPSPEPPPVIRATLGIVGEALYPPLQIVEMPPTNSDGEFTPITLDFFMIPDTFNETFKSRWSAEDLSHGRINPIHNYGGTTREIALSFTLAAFTVAESRSNLVVCQKLARTVYGRYRRLELTNAEAAGVAAGTRVSTVFGGHREFKVDFGGLIRDEKAFINKFAFTADMDAGVFDYSPGDDTDVTHGTHGVILPRAVKIEIGFTITHDRLLGFGGQNRPGDPLRWAHNPTGINRDWPHGTGQIGVQEYMKKGPKRDLSSLPRVIRPGAEDFDAIPRSSADIISEAMDTARAAAAEETRERAEDAALETASQADDYVPEQSYE